MLISGLTCWWGGGMPGIGPWTDVWRGQRSSWRAVENDGRPAGLAGRRRLLVGVTATARRHRSPDGCWVQLSQATLRPMDCQGVVPSWQHASCHRTCRRPSMVCNRNLPDQATGATDSMRVLDGQRISEREHPDSYTLPLLPVRPCAPTAFALAEDGVGRALRPCQRHRRIRHSRAEGIIYGRRLGRGCAMRTRPERTPP